MRNIVFVAWVYCLMSIFNPSLEGAKKHFIGLASLGLTIIWIVLLWISR